jgi:hypothetical protein
MDTIPHHEERNAEKWSYELPRRKKLERLIQIAVANIRQARGLPSTRIEPQGQLEEYLDRVSIGGGAPVELFAIQGDPRGPGFISQCPPRKHELQHRYGFQFGHRQDEEKSWWWWLIVDDSGLRPKMTPVQCAPEKDGRPKAKARSDENELTQQPPTVRSDGAHQQQTLFESLPTKQPQTYRDPEVEGLR